MKDNMHAKFNREKLAHAFSIAATVANARSPKEILQNVKLVATDRDHVTLMATDNELGIRITLGEIDVTQPGAVLLPVARMGLILRENTDDAMTISVNGNHTLIKTDSAEFKLPTANPDEFPSVPEFNSDRYHELPAKLFSDMVKRTAFATDGDSSRYALTGVLLILADDGGVIAVGTDGRRLARMTGTGVSIGGHSTPSGATTVIPPKALQLMARSIDEKDPQIEIAVGTNDAMVRTSNCVIYSRLVEGRYPNWKQVIPTRTGSVKIPMQIGSLYAAVRQAAIAADQETRGIDFCFNVHRLVMSAKTAERGSSRIEVPIDYHGQVAIEIKLDHRYLADFLRVLDPESTCTIDIKSESEAAVLTTEDGYTYVVMPMALER